MEEYHGEVEKIKVAGTADNWNRVGWKRLLALLGIFVFGNLFALSITLLFGELGWLVLIAYSAPVMFAAVPAAVLIIGRRGRVSSESEETRVWATLLYVVASATWLFVIWLWWQNARSYFLS